MQAPVRHRLVRTVAIMALAMSASVMAGAVAVTNGAGDPDTGATTPALSAEDWRQHTEADLASIADAFHENFILAVYPDPEGWRSWFDQSLATVRTGVPLVQDEAGYQAVLRHMTASFQDSHVGVYFDSSAGLPSSWPGFLARLDDDGSYRVSASQLSTVADGAAISDCDGKPLTTWISTIARLEIGLPDTLESTRFSAAARLLVDRGSPLRPRPAQCTIDGRAVALDWTSIPWQTLEPMIPRRWTRQNLEASTRLVGDGAWVKLGLFNAADAEQAQAIHAVIDQAASLRDKRFIVLDVRENSGGPYNWFMAYLRALYGQPYADHYATARLHIRNVIRLSPAYRKLGEEAKAQTSEFAIPPDPPFEVHFGDSGQRQAEAIAAGESFIKTPPIDIPRGAAPPENPVRAQVFVLTDSGCASTCIAFVDELKLFPGVQQIGRPTFVDNRTGTPLHIPLASGRGYVRVPAMTRDNRIRDDNEPHVPAIRFNGDMLDDAAVERWFLQDVLTRE